MIIDVNEDILMLEKINKLNQSRMNRLIHERSAHLDSIIWLLSNYSDDN